MDPNGPYRDGFMSAAPARASEMIARLQAGVSTRHHSPVKIDRAVNPDEITQLPPRHPADSSPVAGASTCSIPDHELLKPIGRGSYGEVWLARSALGELRAVKIIWRRDFGEDDRPFRREFEGIQRFEPISRSDPSQLAILHVGKNDAGGCFYYVMEVADAVTENGSLEQPARAKESASAAAGSPQLPRDPDRPPHPEAYQPRTLRSDLKRYGRLPLEQVLEVGIALATALEHLHAHGLVHRDVKPSNIIFVRGKPKLADIGLVAAASGNDDSRSIVGTEGYLPPEGAGTPSADLFAVGKVLYEAVTGLDRRHFPQLPPDLRSRSDIPALLELNEVLLKACAHDGRQRYASARVMLADLKILSAGRSVRSANRVRFWSQIGKRVGAGTALLAAALGLVRVATHDRGQPPDRRAERLSTNALANQLFDRGRLYFEQTTGTGFSKSAENLEQAIAADPNFAQAYASLALTYTWSIDGWSENRWSNLPKARETALKALSLDNSLPEPHLALGMHDVMRDWAWDAAEDEFRRAVQIDRSKPVFHYFHGEYLRMRGRTNEALAEMTEAFNLNRLSVCSNVRLADFLLAARRFEEALAQADQAIAMEPFSHSYGWMFRIRALTALNRFPEAIAAEEKDRVLWGKAPAEVDAEIRALKQAFASDGPAAYWREHLSRMDTDAFYWRARAYAQLGDRKSAIQALKQASEAKDAWLTFYVMTDWTLDPLREDPRFQAILKTMHLR